MAFFEVRQYEVRPDKMDEWLALMEGEVIPFAKSKGMTVIASFRGEDDPTTYIWIRRFEDEAQKVALYEAVYESERWKNELSDKVGALINRQASRIQRVVATGASAIQ